MDLKEELNNILKALDKGNVSDGYHTFNELYRYRMLYNAGFFNELYSKGIKVVKSIRHSDGQLCFGGGWFIVVAILPTGQISNHYELEYFNFFHCEEAERAPEWDGHTPDVAADRLERYLNDTANKSENDTANKSEDWKVGEIRNVNGHFVQCVQAKSCHLCFFSNRESCCPCCSSKERSDACSVKFIELGSKEDIICFEDKRLRMLTSDKRPIRDCGKCAVRGECNGLYCDEYTIYINADDK